MHSFIVRNARSQVSGSLLGELLADLRELDTPSGKLAVGGTPTNRRISLTQCTSVTLMILEVHRFPRENNSRSTILRLKFAPSVISRYESGVTVNRRHETLLARTLP